MIRLANAADVEQLSYIMQSVNPHPWSLQTWQDCLQKPYTTLVFIRERILAYIVLHQILDEFTLMDIGVLPEAQRQGLAAELWQQASALMQSEQATICHLEVRRSNQRAIDWYRKLGFESIAVRPGYYSATATSAREDALIMQKNLHKIGGKD